MELTAPDIQQQLSTITGDLRTSNEENTALQHRIDKLTKSVKETETKYTDEHERRLATKAENDTLKRNLVDLQTEDARNFSKNKSVFYSCPEKFCPEQKAAT